MALAYIEDFRIDYIKPDCVRLCFLRLNAFWLYIIF